MDVYILDDLYRREFVVDLYESLIWTERYDAYGDFQLTVHGTIENRSRFSVGQNIAVLESQNRVMTIETIEDSTNDEGRSVLVMKGRSLERIFINRLARNSLDDLDTTPQWIVEGTPIEIATNIVDDICVDGVLNAGDIIPNLSIDSIFPPDTIPPSTDEVSYAIDLVSLYEALQTLCRVYAMGFYLVRGNDDGELYFDVYTGSDRTSLQTDLPAVIFSPDMDNLKNTSELTSIALYKNVAYVFSPVGHEVVYDLDVDSSIEGFGRNVLIVKASDIIDADPPTATAKMIQRGREELAKNPRFNAMDGEIAQTSQYVYGRDFNLGDLVEKRTNDGSAAIVRVTEQTFISDGEGFKSYPTLTLAAFVEPGSWLARSPVEDWEDNDPDTDWEDEPA